MPPRKRKKTDPNDEDQLNSPDVGVSTEDNQEESVVRRSKRGRRETTVRTEEDGQSDSNQGTNAEEDTSYVPPSTADIPTTTAEGKKKKGGDQKNKLVKMLMRKTLTIKYLRHHHKQNKHPNPLENREETPMHHVQAISLVFPIGQLKAYDNPMAYDNPETTRWNAPDLSLE